MIVAGLETSGRPSSVALAVGERRFEEVLGDVHAHASDLLPALERLLERADVSPRELEVVFVGVGPGSYTGLRVGIATALGLARGSDARVLAVPSGETRAFAECAPGSEVALLLDARQGELYFARYARTESDVVVRVAPCVTTPAELTNLLPSGGAIHGDATVAEAAGLDAETAARIVVPTHDAGFPRASALLELGIARLERGTEDAFVAPEPLYLRPFAAKPRRAR